MEHADAYAMCGNIWDLDPDVLCIIHGKLSVTDRLRWRVARVKPIPRSNIDSTPEDEREVALLLMSAAADNPISWTGARDVVCRVGGPSEQAVRYLCPISGLLDDIIANSVKAEYPGLDLSPFKAWYSTALALGTARVSTFAAVISNPIARGLPNGFLHTVLEQAFRHENCELVAELRVAPRWSDKFQEWWQSYDVFRMTQGVIWFIENFTFTDDQWVDISNRAVRSRGMALVQVLVALGKFKRSA